MILNIIPDEKFVPFLQGLFAEVGSRNLWRVWTDQPDLAFASHNKNTEAVGVKYFFSTKFKKDLEIADCVVFHTLTMSHAIAALRIPEQIPIVWRGWGFDYCDYLEVDDMRLILPETRALIEKSNLPDRASVRQFPRDLMFSILAKTIRPWLMRKFVARANYFSCCVPDDFEALRRVLPNFSAQFLPLNYYSKEDVFLRGENLHDMSGRDILLGNSATPTNNHIEAMRMLSALDMRGRKVIVPLSYGERDYQQQVIRAGKDLLGEAFTPLTKYLTLPEYNQIVSGCGNVMMNHVRQQAIGNVSAALLRGGKVFLRPENPIYKYYTREGAKLFPISADMTSRDFDNELNQVEIDKNKELMTRLWSRSVGLKQVKEISKLGISK